MKLNITSQQGTPSLRFPVSIIFITQLTANTQRHTITIDGEGEFDGQS